MANRYFIMAHTYTYVIGKNVMFKLKSLTFKIQHKKIKNKRNFKSYE